jgi:hypothetical protein
VQGVKELVVQAPGEASGVLVDGRVARFFLVLDTKTGKSDPKEHKMYQMVIKYPECP